MHFLHNSNNIQIWYSIFQQSKLIKVFDVIYMIEFLLASVRSNWHIVWKDDSDAKAKKRGREKKKNRETKNCSSHSKCHRAAIDSRDYYNLQSVLGLKHNYWRVVSKFVLRMRGKRSSEMLFESALLLGYRHEKLSRAKNNITS